VIPAGEFARLTLRDYHTVGTGDSTQTNTTAYEVRNVVPISAANA
jgi:hypothetical protein